MLAEQRLTCAIDDRKGVLQSSTASGERFHYWFVLNRTSFVFRMPRDLHMPCHVPLFARLLGFVTAKTDRQLDACCNDSFAVCRLTGGMTAVPSREVTTTQVSAVTFGFYTEKEVSLSLSMHVRVNQCVSLLMPMNSVAAI